MIHLLAAGDGNGLIYAFEQSTIEGKLILAVLFISSIFSWSVMLTKFRVVSSARRETKEFLEDFRRDRQPLRIFESGLRYTKSPIYNIYMSGCRELLFHLLGSAEVDETFHARIRSSESISSSQMRAVATAMERAVGETALKLESQLILLATAVSGAPFFGLLGTVWGVMDTFASVAVAGAPNIAAMAPGVSGALVTTVIALLVAIPAMLGYNFLLTSIRAMIVQMDNFAAELNSGMEHAFVSHGNKPPLFSELRRPHSVEDSE